MELQTFEKNDMWPCRKEGYSKSNGLKKDAFLDVTRQLLEDIVLFLYSWAY